MKLILRIVTVFLVIGLVSAFLTQEGFAEMSENEFANMIKNIVKHAEQGNANAQNLVGEMYFLGKGVKQDYQEAAKWYRKAAEQGDANAQYNLGLLYENGQGVLKDDIMAYALFNLAAVQGCEEARNNRALLKTKMSQNQIAEAQRLSIQLLAKIESTTNDKATEPDDIGQVRNQIKSTGTGFVINTNAHIVTNYHVISDCKRIEIINSKINSRAKVLFSDEINDLAVLKSNIPVDSYAFLRGGRGIRVGEDITTVGYPLGTFLGESVKVTTGNISAVTGFDNDIGIMQITAPIQLGNSGGPVLDMSGNVVGVVSAKINEMAVVKETGTLLQNINLAIKSQTLQASLDTHQIDYKMKNSDTKLETADIAEAAQEYTIRVTCYE